MHQGFRFQPDAEPIYGLVFPFSAAFLISLTIMSLLEVRQGQGDGQGQGQKRGQERAKRW